MKRFYLTLVILNIILLVMPGKARAEAYHAQLTKISKNRYQSFDGLIVKSKSCYANLFQTPVLIIVDEFALADSFLVDADTQCFIEQLQFDSRTGKQALQPLNQATIYSIDIATDSKLIKLGARTYKQQSFCGTWQKGDQLVLLSEQSLSACVDTVAYNLTQNEACEMFCENQLTH